MKVKELIAYAREVRPESPSHAFSDDVLLIWINEIEGMVQTEILLTSPADIITYTADDLETELLVPAPHSKIYRAYLCSMIDFERGEYNTYSNSVELFREWWNEYAAWYALMYDPASGKGELKGYYISAYAIAVKHGYTGTEEEWLSELDLRVKDAEEHAADSAASAAAAMIAVTKYPMIGEDGYWYVWDTVLGEYAKTSVKGEGAPGEPGKSAYEYAVAGGYPGSEEEFFKDLANIKNAGGGGGGGSDVDLSDELPLMDGVASPGTSEEVSRADHVHPTDISRMPSVSNIASYVMVPTTGGVIMYDGVTVFKVSWDTFLSHLKSKLNYASSADLANHKTDTAAHNDIRLLIEGLISRLNALADSDDTTLDQLSELVAYIKTNRGLIESVTTLKVSVSDIINNLSTNAADKPLSAAQGVELKKLIDAITVPTALSQLAEDGTHRVVTDDEKKAWNDKSDFSGKYADLEGKPTIPSKTSQLTNDSGFLTSVPSEYVTEAELANKKYLTSVPSEYVTESELNAKGYLTQHQDLSAYAKKAEIPTNLSALDNDAGYLKDTELDSAVDNALAEAKASGDFDGSPGYTPVKGTDYWTPADKQEILDALNGTVAIPLTVQGYMEGGNGWFKLNTTRAEARCSGYVAIPDGYTHIKANLDINQYGWAILFSTGNGSGEIYDATVSVLGKNHEHIYDYFVEIPANAKYVFVSSFIYNEGDYALFTNADTEDDSTDVFDRTEFALFKQWGIVGDSLSVGHTADSEGNASSPNLYYSWGQYLARRIGNTCLNFGRSGVSAKEWMSDDNGYNLLVQPDKLCQCYILALGANDTNMTLGSISNVDFSNMDNNADTEYGWYAKVINAIRTTAPQAPIFLFTLPYPRNTDEKIRAINDMIREFAANENFSMVYLVDLDADYNDYFKEGKLGNCIGNTGWHLTALGYLYASIVNEIAISKVMAENPSDFQNVFEIPYGEAEDDSIQISSEPWVFELEDGSTVTKKVAIV